MLRRFAVLVALLLGLLAAPGLAVAQEATPAAESPSPLAGLGYPDLVLTTDGATLQVPADITAGRYRLVVENTSADITADVELYQLPEGMTQDDLLAAFESEDISVFFEVVAPGGVSAEPNAISDAIVTLGPGEWIFNHYIEETETNTPTTVTVTGELPTTFEDPPATVEVNMVEMAFEMPDTIPAGPQIYRLANAGQQPHFIAIFSYPEPVTEQQVIDTLEVAFAPPASPEAGAASPMAEGLLDPEQLVEVASSFIVSAGQVYWNDLDLAPGTYIGICFLPDRETGQSHALMGMVKVFTVE